MTHDILPSDIAFATKLMADHRSDEEILRALANRAADRVQAAKLLDDLRHGRKPDVRSPLPSELTITPRSWSRSRKRPASTGSSHPRRKPTPLPKSPRPPAPSKKRKTVLGKVATASFLILAIAAVGKALLKPGPSGSVALGGTQAKPTVTQPATTRSLASTAASRGAPHAKSVPLVLELQPDGLHINGGLVGGNDILPALTSVLGAPARTNQAAPAGTIIYAYDDHGLLIYSQPGGRANHIVLDCEATGGANGTISPFAGTLKVGDQVIGPDTDSQALSGIKELGLDNRKGGGAIWGGHYHSLGLSIAYLKSPERPSLIEIDLK